MFLIKLLKVSGHSMEPTIKNGSIIIISSIPYFFGEPKIEDIILFKNEKINVIKRIKNIKENELFVQGDNKNDSLSVGWINRKDILGKLLFQF